jgi:hypothetical protein
MPTAITAWLRAEARRVLRTAPPVMECTTSTYIHWMYWALIPMTLGFMIFHHVQDFLAKLIRRRPRHESGGTVMRMNRNFRIAHWGITLSFPTLVYTGFVLKYPEAWWARPALLSDSHFAFRGAVHRYFAGVDSSRPLYFSMAFEFGGAPRHASYILARSSVLPRESTISRKRSPLARLSPPFSINPS